MLRPRPCRLVDSYAVQRRNGKGTCCTGSAWIEGKLRSGAAAVVGSMVASDHAGGRHGRAWVKQMCVGSALVLR